MVESRRILVVDDEKGVRSLLWDVLSSRGFEVSLAKDGRESLQCLEKDSFDLVITDINMPKMDGIQMLKSMKRIGRKEKIIIMTGDPSNKKDPDPEMPPVVTQLQKPFGMDLLLNVVKAAVGGGV